MNCSILNCMARMVVLAFFALTAWNTINDLETHSNSFTGKYQTFQTRVETMTGYNFHPHIHHSSVSQFAEQIVLYLAYASLAFCALGLLKPCAITIPSFLWLVMQVLEHEFLEMTQNRNLKQIEVLALTLAVFISGLLVSCSGKKSKSCCGKKTPKAKSTSSGRSTKSKNSKKKKRN